MDDKEKKAVKEAQSLMGEEKGNEFLAKFGIGPNYAQKPIERVFCPNCHKMTAYYREDHPDTDMNEVNMYCDECGYTTA